MKRETTVIAVAVAAAAMSWLTVPAAVAAPPSAVPVHVKYAVGKVARGSGSALFYNGKVYIPLSAVKQLTGDQVNWDAATSTLSVGTSGIAKTSTYLEDLPGQPFYTASQALCWQTGKNGAVGGMHVHTFVDGLVSPNCNVRLPAKPSIDGQRSSHEMEFLISATGARTYNWGNTIVAKYSLYGNYMRLSGTIGFLDNLNPERMTVHFITNRILYATTLNPGSAPVHFSVNVAHVQTLILWVSNVSGAAPNWDTGYPGAEQYVPGAILIANPVLIANPGARYPKGP